MSWNDFDVFYSIDDDVEKIKQSVFVYNHINIYQSKLCDWVQEKNHVFNQITEWLIHNDILRVVATEEDIEDDLKDKIYSGGNCELMELIHKNKKRIANPTSYPKGYEEILAQTTKKDQEDPFLEEILLKEHRKKHEAELWESELYRDTFTLPNIPNTFKKDINEKLDELYQIKLKFYKRNLKDSHRHYNQHILDQFCSSYSIHIDPVELEYYEYKLTGFRDYKAIRTIEAAEVTLPLVNHELINDFTFEDILEIRQKRTWIDAMRQLSSIVKNIPYTEDTTEFEKQVKEDILGLLFDVIESQKGSVIKDVLKSFTSLGINFIPIVGEAASVGMTIADPLINFCKEKTKPKSLAYFLNDLRNITY